jgi:hypothetical protein
VLRAGYQLRYHSVGADLGADYRCELLAIVGAAKGWGLADRSYKAASSGEAVGSYRSDSVWKYCT